MAVSPARNAAFNILLRVERESAYAVELLHSALLDELSPVDRHLVTEIVMGILRWRSVLDQTIALLSFTPFRKLDLEVLTALRMGVYQKQFLTKVPAHAAVNETVELVKQARKLSAAGLVNAVMRKVKSTAYDPHASKLTGADYLSSALAHPKWLVERWISFFGHDVAQKICEHDQRVPSTVLRLSSAQDESALAAQGIQLAPGSLMALARVVTSGDLSATQIFHEGPVFEGSIPEGSTFAHPSLKKKPAIQDEGSQLVAALVGQGRRILDCCAAPGGKTAAMASRLPRHRRRARLALWPGFRPCPRRRPVLRHRNTGAQSGNQMEAQAGRSSRPAIAPDRHPAGRHAPRRARRKAGLFHLLAGAGRERASRRRRFARF